MVGLIKIIIDPESIMTESTAVCITYNSLKEQELTVTFYCILVHIEQVGASPPSRTAGKSHTYIHLSL